MNIDFSSLSIRSSFYFVTAPQDGYVVQAKVSGVGENIAEGDVICTIMPSDPSLAIQLHAADGYPAPRERPKGPAAVRWLAGTCLLRLAELFVRNIWRRGSCH
ncbi:hypothetical protein [Candidatus Pollutiaquabacter sp.]|uniref:hypothetical protein n=1 Tax=Candidatus Pollutiaquabacter sp. TaxID=3416354 RepID=UPI003D1287EB